MKKELEDIKYVHCFTIFNCPLKYYTMELMKFSGSNRPIGTHLLDAGRIIHDLCSTRFECQFQIIKRVIKPASSIHTERKIIFDCYAAGDLTFLFRHVKGRYAR